MSEREDVVTYLRRTADGFRAAAQGPNAVPRVGWLADVLLDAAEAIEKGKHIQPSEQKTKREERDRLMRVVLRHAPDSVCNDESRALCDFRDDCECCPMARLVDDDLGDDSDVEGRDPFKITDH